MFSPTTPVAFAGPLLWGAGTALGFPVGISAAADEPRAAAGRVGVVSSIGYWAFLGGPPLIGYLGDQHGVLGRSSSASSHSRPRSSSRATCGRCRPTPPKPRVGHNPDATEELR